MEFNYNIWDKIDDLNLDEVVNYIWEGGNVDSLYHDKWILKFIEESDSPVKILDFGCGVGRNAFGISQENKNFDIVAYDNPKMLYKASQYCYKKYGKPVFEFSNIKFTSDWEYVKTNKFDYMYATLVLQHICEEDLNKYCQDFKKITKNLIVHGRRHNDEILDGKYKNTWEILENNGLFPVSCTIQGIHEHKYIVHSDDLGEHFTCLYKF